MSKYDLRDDLLSGNQLLAVETQGFFRGNDFTQLIDKAIVPNTADSDGELADFLPVVVSVDKDNEQVEFPNTTKTTAVGAVACFENRAVFGWMSGMIRLKFGHHAVDYAAITKVEPFTYRDLRGIDISEQTKWSVLFAEQLPNAVAQSFSDRLIQCLQAGQGSSGESAPLS